MTAGACWQHSRAETGFAVKVSTIPNSGRGLFAARDLKAGDRTLYAGPAHRMTRAQLDAIYPGDTLAPYGFCSGNVCWDARSTQSGLGRYANDSRGAVPHNAIIVANKARTHSYLQITRAVPKGEEVFAHYGLGYWDEPAGGGVKAKAKAKCKCKAKAGCAC